MIRRLTIDDVGWAVELLARRRAGLMPYAPVYWRPAGDAVQAHRRFLAYVLTRLGGLGWRTEDALLIAAPGENGWAVDDAVVPDDQWQTTGQQLWRALAKAASGERVRLVCPVPEPARASFACAQGLCLNSSWWHMSLDRAVDAPGEEEEPLRVPGARAESVSAPRIYDPGGPVLFLREVSDPRLALACAPAQARRHGCPIVVVEQPHDDRALSEALAKAGYVRHCEFFDGTLS